MNFDDIIGQSMMVKSLKSIIKEGKAANGYIFSGPKGCGKKMTAFTFALALNCSASYGEKPCGTCSSCIRLQNGNHPNIEVIKPKGASIKIEQIKQIISEVSKKPFENGYKIIILESADKMTPQAQDAFLKTLEEPPESTIFMLLVENQYSLLPTVLSRCQTFSLRSVALDEVEKYLKSRLDYSDSQIKLATANSNGIIGRAVEMLKDENYFKQRDDFFVIVDQVFKADYTKVSELTARTIDGKPKAEAFVDFLMTWFRDILVYREMSQANNGLIINIDRLSDISRHSELLNDTVLDGIIANIKRAMEYIKHNVSIKNGIEGMLLNIMEVCNGKDSRGKI